jgi:hypothetical protein
VTTFINSCHVVIITPQHFLSVSILLSKQISAVDLTNYAIFERYNTTTSAAKCRRFTPVILIAVECDKLRTGGRKQFQEDSYTPRAFHAGRLTHRSSFL